MPTTTTTATTTSSGVNTTQTTTVTTAEEGATRPAQASAGARAPELFHDSSLYEVRRYYAPAEVFDALGSGAGPRDPPSADATDAYSARAHTFFADLAHEMDVSGASLGRSRPKSRGELVADEFSGEPLNVKHYLGLLL
jgi:hypothetical protein